MANAKQSLFIDASVFIAASGSLSGGSSLVLEVCQSTRFRALCSRRVLLEAQHNIRGKMGSAAMLRFYHLLADVSPTLVTPVSKTEEAAYTLLVGQKDAHVIASAVKGQADFLISLDRKHLVNDKVRSAGLPFSCLTPGEFLQSVLRFHPAP
jgi:predicted nucleic acid-binding protein